jgi:uncharacterized membrane-anchored protein
MQDGMFSSKRGFLNFFITLYYKYNMELVNSQKTGSIGTVVKLVLILLALLIAVNSMNGKVLENYKGFIGRAIPSAPYIAVGANPKGNSKKRR